MIIDHRTYELQPGQVRDIRALHKKEQLSLSGISSVTPPPRSVT